MSDYDITDLQRLEQEKLNAHEDYGQAMIDKWLPFGALLLKSLNYNVLNIGSGLKNLLKDALFGSMDTRTRLSPTLSCIWAPGVNNHDYKFIIKFKNKTILSMEVASDDGYVDRVPLGIVEKSFFADGAYADQIKESYLILKDKVKEKILGETQTIDVNHALHQLTFEEQLENLEKHLKLLEGLFSKKVPKPAAPEIEVDLKHLGDLVELRMGELADEGCHEDQILDIVSEEFGEAEIMKLLDKGLL